MNKTTLEEIFEMDNITLEQFFPTRWILRGMTRDEFGQHLRKLHRIDRKLVKKCISHAYWVGVYPRK